MEFKPLFLALINQYNNPQLICTLSGEILLCNSAASHFFGAALSSGSSIKSLLEEWHPTLPHEKHFFFYKSLSSPNSAAQLLGLEQSPLRTEHGEYIWVRIDLGKEDQQRSNNLSAKTSSLEYNGLLTTDGTLLHLSEQLLALLNKPLMALVGTKFWDCGIFGNDEQKKSLVRDTCSREAGGLFIRFELDIEKKNGEIHLRSFSLKPAVSAPHKAMAHEQYDLTDTPRQNLLSIVEATPDLIASADIHGRLFYLNQAGRTLLQIGLHDDISQYLLDDVHSEEMSIHLRETGLKAAMEHGYWRGESTWKRMDGSEFLSIQTIIGHRDAQGNFLHFSTLAKDLSQLQHMEQLLNSERRFSESLLKNMHDGYSLLSKQGVVLDVNNALCNMIGYQREELIGKQVPLPHWPASLKDEILEIYLNMEEYHAEPFETIFQHKNGKLIPVLISPTSLRNESGQVDFFFNTIKDITDYKNAVTQLTDSQTFIQTILRTTPSQIYILDLTTGNMVFTNNGTTRLLGYTEAEVEEMGPAYFLKLLHPEEVSGLAEFYNYMKTIEDNVVVEREYRMRAKNGEYRYFYSYNSVFKRNAFGEVIQLGGSAVDITESKKIQKAADQQHERLSALIDKSHEVFIICTPEKLMYVSANVEQILGYTVEEYETIPITELVHPDDFPLRWNELEKPGSSLMFEYQIKHKNGSWRWMESYGVNLTHLESVKGLVFNMRDITERKKSELTLAMQTSKLKAQNAQLEQFTYVASHDLQEPLRTLISCVDVLLLDYAPKLDEDVVQFLNFIKQSSERMTDLITGLLNFGRIGKNPDPQPVDTKALVEVVLADLKNAIDKTEATITTSNLPTVVAHPNEMRMLLQNLVSNAIKFSRKNVRPVVHIQAQHNRGNWVFSVSDNGIGIENKHTKSIFVIFKRLNNRTAYEGTGIGLAICKKIVELHGGEIWVHSAPDVGSTFHFTIPD